MDTPSPPPSKRRRGALCTAKSKRTKERCRALAAFGTHLCRNHGAGNVGKPSKALKHGRYSRYVALEDVPALLDNLEALSAKDGRKALLATSAAVSEIRSAKVPEAEHATWLAYRREIRSDVTALTELERDAAAPVAPTFVVGVQQGGVERFVGRIGDGNATGTIVRLGERLYLEADGGALFPVVAAEVDGIEVFRRVLDAPSPEDQ